MDALERAGPDVSELARRLVDVSHPVVACRERAAHAGHARVACLAGLGLSDLLTLVAELRRPVQLDATACVGCRNAPAMDALRRRIEALDENGVRGQLRLVTSPAALRFEPRRLERRALFRTMLREGASALTRRERRAPPVGIPRGGKHRPRSLDRTRTALGRLPKATQKALRPLTGFEARATSACDACGRCAAVCPTGALTRVRSRGARALEFEAASCVGCDVCVDFCPVDALRVTPATTDSNGVRHRLAAHAPHQETPA